MKKAPQGSCKKLFFRGITMRKNIYKHFYAFDIGFKNGVVNNLYPVYVRKIVPEFYYWIPNIVITLAAKSLIFIIPLI